MLMTLCVFYLLTYILFFFFFLHYGSCHWCQHFFFIQSIWHFLNDWKILSLSIYIYVYIYFLHSYIFLGTNSSSSSFLSPIINNFHSPTISMLFRNLTLLCCCFFFFFFPYYLGNLMFVKSIEKSLSNLPSKLLWYVFLFFVFLCVCVCVFFFFF